MDLKELIDEAVADGPAHRPVEERLVAGRALVRRRRIGVGAAALATAAVVGLGAAALAGGSDPDSARDPGFARATASSAEPALPTPSARASHRAHASATLEAPKYSLAPEGQMEPVISRADSPVRYAGDRLVAKEGAMIVATIADPQVSSAAVPAGADATAVRVSGIQGDWFVLGWKAPDGEWDLLTEPAGLRARTLPAWLDAVAAAQDGGAGAR